MECFIDSGLDGDGAPPRPFNTDPEYHFKCLQGLFLRHYQTWCISRKYRNKHWTTHLPTTVIHQLRVHLSWIQKNDSRVYVWTRVEVGKKIIKLLKKNKKLNKLIRTIRKMENNVCIYMEHTIFNITY